MKIVFLVSSLNAGGAERVASTLCNTWVARGDSVTLIPTFSGGGTPFYSLDNRVELVYLASVVHGSNRSIFGYVKRLLALRKLIGDRKPDVVVSFLANVNIAAVLATRGLRIPLVICERTDPSVAPLLKLMFLATQCLYRFADALVVQTQEVAAKSVKLFPGAKRIRAIGNPVLEDLLSLKSAHGLERKIFLSLGRIADEKQVHLIIEAFLQIHNTFSEWDLHIYGDGPSKAALENIVRDSGIRNRIFFKGRTTTVAAVMLNADAFAMTSRFEGFPNALLEAMATGLPCVCFDCPSGPREISSDGKYARLVAPGDVNGLASAIAELFGNETLRHELGRQARESVQQRYSLTAVLAQWDRLFHEVGVTHEPR